jgi:hypothetical protein
LSKYEQSFDNGNRISNIKSSTSFIENEYHGMNYEEEKHEPYLYTMNSSNNNDNYNYNSSSNNNNSNSNYNKSNNNMNESNDYNPATVLNEKINNDLYYNLFSAVSTTLMNQNQVGNSMVDSTIICRQCNLQKSRRFNNDCNNPNHTRRNELSAIHSNRRNRYDDYSTDSILTIDTPPPGIFNSMWYGLKRHMKRRQMIILLQRKKERERLRLKRRREKQNSNEPNI